MHLSNKIEQVLEELFASLDRQQTASVQENLKQTIALLDSSGHRVLIFMHSKKINFDEFMADKCLPLIRFYLAPNKVQREIFLSQEKLGSLFAEIPTVEAFLFKNAITLALQKRKAAQEQAKAVLTPFPTARKEANIMQEKEQFLLKKKSRHFDCFYHVQDGNLQILNNQQDSPEEVLIYRELSPLQQLEAQKLCKAKPNKLISAKRKY